MPIETERLRLREFALEDTDFVLALYNSPGFLEFIGDRGIKTQADADAYLRDNLIASYGKHGHGLYAVELKDSFESVGACGLVKRDGLNAPDIGFAFLPKHMRRGYGYEASRAAIKDGRERLKLTRILAITDPANDASIALLEKLGLSLEGMIQLPGDDQRIKLFSTGS